MLVPPGRPGLCLSLKGPDVTPGVTRKISVGGNFSELRTGLPRGCLNSHRDAADSNLNKTPHLEASVMTSERMKRVLLLVCLRTTAFPAVSGPAEGSAFWAPRGLLPRGSCEYPMYQYAALLPTRTTGGRPVDIWGVKTPQMPFKSENNEQKPPILTPKLARSSRTGIVRVQRRGVSLAPFLFDLLLTEAGGGAKVLRRAEKPYNMRHWCARIGLGVGKRSVSRLCRVCAHDLGVICASIRLEAQEWYKPRA
jgi:hypothetical protein